MPKTNKIKHAKKTIKKLFIIESDSSSSKSKKSSSKSNKKTKQNITVKKKPIFIIESSSTPSPEVLGEKEKIDFFNPQILSDRLQTNLKITQEVKQMSNLSDNITLPSGRLNEKFIDLMEQLANIMLKQGEPFRARAYQKAQETIMSYPDDILSPNDLKGKPGMGPTIMEKLNEYMKTGTLRVLEREKTNPVNILAEVYGIGPKKAKELVDEGITSITQLRENQNLLNDVQKVGLNTTKIFWHVYLVQK